MRRDWLTLAFGVALVGLVVGLSLRPYFTRDEPEQTPAPEPAATAPAPAAVPAAAAVAPAEPGVTGRDDASRVKAAPVAAVAAAPNPAESKVDGTAVLQVQSDVAGAAVFLDREFVGTTPLTLRGLTPGNRQINVTATGHDGYADTVALSEGTNRVQVEFLKVRLDTSVPVVHRHAMGTCQGMLTASAKGLTYETANDNDGFSIALAQIDVFEFDHVKKNLRVRRLDGKTWNFTNASADALVVFHRDVTTARQKLATR